jgi:hypothetical protein
VTKEQPRPAGASASSPATWFPAPVIFGHFLLAATGLVVWIVYLIADKTPLAWAAFIVLLPVALLGFTMFARADPRGTSHPGHAVVNEGAGRCVMKVADLWPSRCKGRHPDA